MVFDYWFHKNFSKPEERCKYSSRYWQDNRILIMDAGGIGDLVMATPLLRALRERFKKSHITLLVVPRAAEAVKKLPYFDELIEFDIGNRLESLRLLWRLRRRRFDMMIDLQAIESWPAALRRMLLYLIVNPRIKVGRNTDHRGFFLDIKVPEDFLGTVHEVERKLSIANALGAEVAVPNCFNRTNVELKFKLSESDRASVEAFLDEHGIEDGQFMVGLNPGSFLPTRRWDKNRFIEIGRRVASKYEAQLIITGGNREKTLIREIAESLQDTVPIEATEFTLGELAALLRRINLFITNDTGPMHIAAAVGTPIIAIFGPENYHRYRPYSKSFNRVVAISPISCRPCRKFDCKSHECMKAVSIGMVWEAVESAISYAKQQRRST